MTMQTIERAQGKACKSSIAHNRCDNYRGHCCSAFCGTADRSSVFAIPFALRLEIIFPLRKARPDRQVLHTIGASDKACADSHKKPDRQLARADEEYHPRGAGSCDFASQSSSLRSLANLMPAAQVHLRR